MCNGNGSGKELPISTTYNPNTFHTRRRKLNSLIIIIIYPSTLHQTASPDQPRWVSEAAKGIEWSSTVARLLGPSRPTEPRAGGRMAHCCQKRNFACSPYDYGRPPAALSARWRAAAPPLA